jgi:hypothetical protein
MWAAQSGFAGTLVRPPIIGTNGLPPFLHELELLQALVLFLLFSDVLANHFFVSPDRRHKVSPCPKVLTHEVALVLPVFSSDVDRALPFDVTHPLRDRNFGGGRVQQVNMTFDHLALFPLCPLPLSSNKIANPLLFHEHRSSD